MDDLIREFLVESYENLDQLDRDLVALEQCPGDRERLSSIFRTIHTIKGTCGFFGYSRLEGVSHAGENLLGSLRDGDLSMTPETTSALLATIDAIREILACLEDSGGEGDTDYTALIDTLTRLNEQRVAHAAGPASADAADPTDVTPEPGITPVKKPSRGRAVRDSGSRKSSRARPTSAETDSQASPVPAAPAPTPRLGDILVESGRVAPDELRDAIEEQAHGDPRPVGEILVAQGIIDAAAILEALSEQRDPRPAAPASSRSAGISEANLRVGVSLLDHLMNLVGELVLTRNQILQFAADQKDPAFQRASSRLNLITTELQEGIMKTRMQPIDNVWSKFPRVVRDLAITCGKQVRVEMEGRETELDKTLIEAIKDPLTHLVRNAVDHGIEEPEARARACKPPEGCLTLRAYHEGGQVSIEIADDGDGIDPDRLKQKALARGLISPEQAARMTERELLGMIFLPGFSTAERVTKVSGRGVGMDVVKTNIEKIGGTLDLQSELGRGTTVRIKIPLTLAIIPVLTVTCGGGRYAIPQISLLELVRLEGDKAARGFERIHGAPVYRLRGNLLPLVHLGHELALEDPTAPIRRSGSEVVNIVVLQAHGLPFGLVVEGIHDTEEIVVKPLGRHLKSIPVFAGATIMGDGRVALILDVLGLAQRAGVLSETRDTTPAPERDAARDDTTERQNLLVLGVGADTRVAFPLDAVARIEEFPRSLLERSSGREVVQYRGDILPLLFLSRYLECRPSPARDAMPVVVCLAHGREIGLVVDRILDIVEDDGRHAVWDGLASCAVIQESVTDLLDIAALVDEAGVRSRV